MSSHPHFLFVGTAKAGTTSIYKYLKQHPRICIPKKETFFFVSEKFRSNTLQYPYQRNKKNVVFKENEFSTLYEDCGDRITGEIGTGYLYYHEIVIPKLLDMLGRDIPIFIVLRNPVDRAFSSYMHFVKDTREQLSFSEGLKAESDRMNKDWDFMWHYKALGNYDKQVKSYLEVFSHVKVLFYEDLKRNPQKFMNDLFSELRLQPIDLENIQVHNPSGKPKNERLQEFLVKENLFKKLLRKGYYSLFGKERVIRWREKIKDKNIAKGTIPDKEKQWLEEYYRQDIQNLERLLNRVTGW